MLVFSQGFDIGRGGFLGISSAFTISGFLLATLALAEWSQGSRLQLGRFWERRARRIVPPTYLIILAVAVLQASLRVGSVPTFRGDVVAGVTFLTNWRLAFPAEGFARGYSELSALSHLWPIAITAQVFLLFPLVFKLMMFVTGRQWRIAGAIFGGGALVSFAMAWVLSSDPDTRDLVYYGTHTRIGELLVGVVLGYAVLSPAFRQLIGGEGATKILRWGALAALVVLGLLWAFVPSESMWVFHGVTLLNALLTAWVVLAVTMPGPAASLLGVMPLRRLGEISFAAYLVHWPIYLLLDEDRLGIDGPALFGVRVAVTLVLAIVIHSAIEAPVRWRIPMPRPKLAGAGAAAAVALVAVVFVAPVNPPNGISLSLDTGDGPGDLDVVTPAGGRDEAVRALVVGDEVAGSMVSGFEAWNAAPEHTQQQFRVDTHVTPGCPIGGADTRVALGQTVEPTLDCEAWRPRLPRMLDAADYDVIVVAMGVGDLGERKIGRRWEHLGNAGYDRWLADEIDATADVLAQAGVPVVWATTPHMRIDDDDPATSWPDFDDNDPHRVDLLNELLVATIGEREGFEVVHLDAWLHDVPRGAFNPELRTGARFTDAGAAQAVGWLAPLLLATVDPEPAEESADPTPTEAPPPPGPPPSDPVAPIDPTAPPPGG